MLINPVILSIIYRRQNPLELTGNLLISCAPVASKKGLNHVGLFLQCKSCITKFIKRFTSSPSQYERL
jgi:hypothetical protein